MPEIKPIPSNGASLCAVLHAASFSPGEAWDAVFFSKLLALPTTRGFFAMENETPAGFVLWQHGPEWGEILTLAILPEARRCGYAQAVLKAAEQVMAKDALLRSVLDVGADNIAARALYESAGYTIINTRKGYYARASGARIDALVMEKNL